MDQGFVSDTPVSAPINSDKFTLDSAMNGFGWDVNNGMFIPVDQEISYFTDPYPKTIIQVIPND